MIDNEMRARMLADLNEFGGVARMQEGDLTVADVAENQGLGQTAAKRRADAMVDAGRWTRHKVLRGQQWLWVYRRVEA